MYSTIYDLLLEHIYGLNTVLTGDMELTLTLLSTLFCVFVVVLPFLVCWRIIKLFL